MYNIDDFFDSVAKSSARLSGRPQYNIRYCNENTSAIDIACPGFSTDDIKVVTERQRLTISGTKSPNNASDDPNEYVFRGINTSDFNMSFKLHEYAVIKTVTLVNGILSVYIELVIPENKQTKVIPISTDPVLFVNQRVTVSDDVPVLLTEDPKEDQT